MDKRKSPSLQHRLSISAKRRGMTLEQVLNKYSAGLRWCYECKDWHPKEQMAIRRTRREGLDNICKLAASTRTRAWQKKYPDRYQKYLEDRKNGRQQTQPQEIAASERVQAKATTASGASSPDRGSFDLGAARPPLSSHDEWEAGLQQGV